MNPVRVRPTRVSRPGRWSFWKYNWIANHKLLVALRVASRHAHGALLEIGCGSKPFADVFGSQVTDYIGTDLVSSAWEHLPPDVYARAEELPFRDRSMDTVLGLSVMNYLPDPARALVEAHRVLRPGGVVILEFAQMVAVSAEPHDYFRFTRYGAERLLSNAGFETIEALPMGGLATKLGMSMIASLNRINRGPTRVITELPVRALYIAIQLLFEALDRLFFDPRETMAHLIVARRRPASEAA